MSITADVIKLRFDVQPKYDQQQMNELKGDLKDTESALKKTHKEIEKNTDSYKRLTEELKNLKANRDRLNAQKMRTAEEEKQLARINQRITECSQKIEENKNRGVELSRMYREQTVAVQNANKKLEDFFEQMDLGKMPLSDLISRQKDLNILVRNLKPDTDDFKKYTKALQETEVQIAKTKEEIYGTKDALEKSAGGWKSYLKMFNEFMFAINGALTIKDRIVSWADQYVQAFAKMDDAMTDVMKYTGQTKSEVEDMNEAFKQMTTRTAREELNALAGAAGRLGIQGKENIIGFVDAADKINVALGDDLGEGAIDQIGKLTMVFGEDKTKGLNGAMLATGSAINELGANSSANTGFITEFTSRVAGMAVQARISQTDIMGYASALSQAGVEGEVASGVFAQFVTKMFTDPAKFAKAAGLEVKAFTDLLKTDANQAILQFLQAMKDKGGFDQLAPMLKSLKMQGTQAIPVLTAMAGKLTELKEAQQLAADAYNDGTSIIREFDNANSSAAAKLEIAKKKLNDVAVELGQKLMPIVEGSINTGSAALKIISSLVTFVIEYKAAIIGLTTVITYYTVAANAAAIKTAVYTTAVNAAKIATWAFNTAIKANPIGLMVGGLAAAVAWLTSYTQKTKEAREAKEALDKESFNPDGTIKSDPTIKKRNELDEVVVTGTRKPKADNTPTAGSDGTSDRKKKEREKQYKELEAQAKAAWEREKLELRQQYEGKKQLQDEWHQKEYNAETRYLAKIGSLRDEYNASESEKMEAQNQMLDAIIREANYQEELRKRKQQESLRNIDQYQAEEEVRLARERLEGGISTQEEFSQKKLAVEIRYQKMRLQYLQQGSQEYLAAQKQLLAIELQQQKQNEKEKEDFQKSYYDTGNQSLQNVMSDLGAFDERLEMNQAYYDADLINFEQYQQNKTAIEQEQTEARQEIQQAAIEVGNQALQAAQQLFQIAQQRETAAVDAKYKKLIASAKKQGKDTTKLEEQQEAEKMAIKKKYAQKEFQMKVLQIVSSTAMAIADVWSKWAGTPYVAAALTAAAAAMGAIQLASAKAAADQAAGLYEGGYSDEYQEGYTKKGNPREQAGVIPVHKSEFVANHKAVANPEVRPVLDVIDRHQKAGDIQMLNSTRMLEEAYGRGRYRGGYTQNGGWGDQGEDGPQNMQSGSSEMTELLRRIEENTADSLTIREVRDAIRRIEHLEKNAQR